MERERERERDVRSSLPTHNVRVSYVCMAFKFKIVERERDEFKRMCVNDACGVHVAVPSCEGRLW